MLKNLCSVCLVVFICNGYFINLKFVILTGGILRGSRRERLLSKFVESECEKIDRLMELYMR